MYTKKKQITLKIQQATSVLNLLEGFMFKNH